MQNKKSFTKRIVDVGMTVLLLCLMIFILSATAQAAGKKKVLVAYFSVTNNTKAAAQDIAKASGGKLYRIKPAQ